MQAVCELPPWCSPVGGADGGWLGEYGWSNKPPPLTLKMLSRLFWYRWASLASKEGALKKQSEYIHAAPSGLTGSSCFQNWFVEVSLRFLVHLTCYLSLFSTVIIPKKKRNKTDLYVVQVIVLSLQVACKEKWRDGLDEPLMLLTAVFLELLWFMLIDIQFKTGHIGFWWSTAGLWQWYERTNTIHVSLIR